MVIQATEKRMLNTSTQKSIRWLAHVTTFCRASPRPPQTLILLPAKLLGYTRRLARIYMLIIYIER